MLWEEDSKLGRIIGATRFKNKSICIGRPTHGRLYSINLSKNLARSTISLETNQLWVRCLPSGAYHITGTLQAKWFMEGLGGIGVHGNKSKTMLCKPTSLFMSVGSPKVKINRPRFPESKRFSVNPGLAGVKARCPMSGHARNRFTTQKHATHMEAHDCHANPASPWLTCLPHETLNIATPPTN
jgi:hypothetical protein